jgi:DNA-binding CsgD family transcriptional regulator
VPAESRQLDRMILQAATETKPGSMMLSDRAGDRAAMVLVTPFIVDTVEHFEPGHAMLAVRPLTGRPSFDADLLRNLFRLSPAQAALAVALYEGKSFEDIAEARNVKVSTLRTHFSEVLNRTGAKRLRDLIRILGEIPPLR